MNYTVELTEQEMELLIQCIEITVGLAPQDDFDNIKLNPYESVPESELDELREKLTETLEE